MTEQPPRNGNATFTDQVNSVAENSFAKIFARYVMPMALAAIGYLMVDKLTSIHEDSAKTQAAVLALGTKVDAVALSANSTHSELKVLAGKVEANRDRADTRAEQLEKGVQGVERATAVDRKNLEHRLDELLRAVVAKTPPTATNIQ